METKTDIFKALKEKYQAPSCETWNFGAQDLLIPQASVVEVVGHARMEFVVNFCTEQADLTVACVEREWTLFPPAVAQRGVDITRWLMVEAGEKDLWVIEELLASDFFSVIVAPDLKLNLPLWRRLHLECQRSGTTLFILSEEAHHQVGSLFLIEAQWREGNLDSQWQRCRQLLKAGG